MRSRNLTSPASFFAVIVLITCFAGPASAAVLLGSSVTGVLQFNGGGTNFFDPANGFVPVGPLNKTFGPTVTIGAGTEFGFADGANAISANFTDTTLTITVNSATASGIALTHFGFTDSAFAGLSFLEQSDNFPAGSGLTASLVGNTFSLDYAGDSVLALKTGVYTFSLPGAGGGAAAPLPLAVWPGLALGAGIWMRGRRNQQQRA
jgi:hypothetical protein